MAERQNPGSDALNSAAEIAGRALGRVAGQIESLRAQHPDPLTERAKKAVKQARKTVSRRAARLKRWGLAS